LEIKDILYKNLLKNSLYNDYHIGGEKLISLQLENNCVPNHTLLAYHFQKSNFYKQQQRKYKTLGNFSEKQDHPDSKTFAIRLNKIETNIVKKGLSKNTLIPYQSLLWDFMDFWDFKFPYYRFDAIKLLNTAFDEYLNHIKTVISDFKGQNYVSPVDFNQTMGVLWGCFESNNIKEAELLALNLYKIVLEVREKRLDFNNFGDPIKNTPRVKMSLLILLLSIYNSQKDRVNFTEYWNELRKLDASVNPNGYNIDYIVGVNRLVEHNVMNYELTPSTENKNIVIESFLNHVKPYFFSKHNDDPENFMVNWRCNDGVECVLERALVANRIYQLFFE